MALVCLAMLCMSSTETASIDTRPYIYVSFEYNEINVHAGRTVDLTIFFKNANWLYFYREDDFTPQEIPFNVRDKNNPDMRITTHSVVIEEYDYTVRYYIVAESEDGSETWTFITLHTYPNLEP
ncbi:MAG: hypothetical protein J6Q35_01365 [Rikenellaceae bacterium]|nr:hypothetical protein [Rikenellaceae bacterium]